MPKQILELRRELTENPGSVQFVKLGELLRQAGEAAEAAVVLRKGLEHHPRHTAAWVALGRVLAESREGAQAAAALKRALELDPAHPVAWRLMGECRLLCGDQSAALLAMERALELAPGDRVLAGTVEALRHEIGSTHALSQTDAPVEVARERTADEAEAVFAPQELPPLPTAPGEELKTPFFESSEDGGPKAGGPGGTVFPHEPDPAVQNPFPPPPESATPCGQPTRVDPLARGGDQRRRNLSWQVGQRVSGRYAIRRILGQGGMGVVAIAFDRLLRKEVALKAILPALTSSQESLSLFFKEVAIAHSVTHPNIIRTHDLGEDDGVYFFSMEYLEGESLAQRLTAAGGSLSPEEGRSIGRLICQALEAAHSAGVVHRDLKPSNIMLVKPPRHLVVLDFGISGFTDRHVRQEFPKGSERLDTGWAVTSLGMGTPLYMPPEQWQRQPCGPAADLYSLAALLFHCLTGRPPFKEQSLAAYRSAHLEQTPPRLREIDPRFPADLDEVIAVCLRKNPDERLQSAREFSESITTRRTWSRIVEFAARGVTTALVLAGIGWGIYRLGAGTILEEMKPNLLCVAESAANRIDTADLDSIHTVEDVRSDAFRRVHQTLRKRMQIYPDVKYIYVSRRLGEGNWWQYVVQLDCDDPDVGEDHECRVEGLPGTVWDGSAYPAADLTLAHGTPTSDERFLVDGQFGPLLGGYMRVGETAGENGYIVAVDISNRHLITFQNGLVALLAVIWGLVMFVPQQISRHIQRRLEKRQADMAEALSGGPPGQARGVPPDTTDPGDTERAEAPAESTDPGR